MAITGLSTRSIVFPLQLCTFVYQTISRIMPAISTSPLSVAEHIQPLRAAFAADKTRDLAFRKQALLRFAEVVAAAEQEILDAVYADFRKPPLESYASEVGMIAKEARTAAKKLPTWAKPERVGPALLNLPSSDRIYREPFGTVLIIGAWNYPFQLALMPLIGAVAAGNTVVLKPSEVAPRSSALLCTLIARAFEPWHVTAIPGDAAVAGALLEQSWDYIFYTGSTHVGRIVMQAAAKNLTPVTLELGGKSPCWVFPDADMEVTARRIIFGKFLNAGQTCIAPDYILVHKAAKERLIPALIEQIEAFYSQNPKESPDLARIVSDKHFFRLTALLDSGTVAYGGQHDITERYISPTLLDNVSWDAAVMQEEIFGPILPIIEFSDINDTIQKVNSGGKPLAMYIFTSNRQTAETLIARVPFGGGCVNDTIVQMLNEKLPFGGVGSSGMGAYHGRHTFETFSHRKSVVHKPFWGDISLRYPPYAGKEKLWKRMLK